LVAHSIHLLYLIGISKIPSLSLVYRLGILI
jgi:hypothetical protein